MTRDELKASIEDELRGLDNGDDRSYAIYNMLVDIDQYVESRIRAYIAQKKEEGTGF